MTLPLYKTVATEPRWPGLIAVMAAAILNLLLPEALSAGPGWAAVAAIAVLAVGALLLPHFHTYFGYAAATIVTIVLGHALYVLVADLAVHKGQPTELLAGAVLIWSMNIFVFASWYWRLDAGGPHMRARHEVYCGGAFLFPQISLPKEARRALGAEDWRPQFIDYLFLAFNTSTAFSPTDVPVLSHWAKILMMIQSSIALTTLAVVAARAVNILLGEAPMSQTESNFSVEPVAYVHSVRQDLSDDDWGAVVARVELTDAYGAESLTGLEEFSHVEVVYLFHRVPAAEIERGARHPRGNAEWPRTGIFAQRAKGRPNRIGTTIAEIVSVEGRVLTVRGLDAIDGTPVIDLKPVMQEFLPRGPVREPDWARELMRDYW